MLTNCQLISPKIVPALIAAAAVVLCLPPGAGAALQVRVESRNGAPRLLVNGQPVRARIFFGGPGSAPVHVGPEGREVSFTFTAEADSEGRGTLHFRFGQTPGNVFLDNIRIVDTAAGQDIMPSADFEQGPGSFARDWTTWPPGPQNTVGSTAVEPGVGANGSAGLHVTLKPPPDGKWPDWHVYHLTNLAITRGKTYRVSFWSRAEPARDLNIGIYRPGQPFVHLGGPPGPFPQQIALAAGAGVDMVSFPIGMPWPAPGETADWGATDAACEEVLRANPKALLIPRLGADPPEWWRKAHPGEMMTWEDGSQQYTAVPASPLYRRDAAARVAALVEHLETKFGDHVAGYHICGQNTGEWFYKDTWGSLLNGYSPADTAGWRAWLHAHYGTDAALQAAWNDPQAALDTAAVPSPQARRASPNGIIRDPRTEQSLVDFADFQQDAMADCVCQLAHAAREASHGRKLVLFFYGYVFEFAGVRLGPTTAGHYALRKVLNSPDIDVLCSPISYFDRGPGGSAPAMTAAESVTLAGKMWLFEDDTATYLSTGDAPGSDQRVKTLAETNAQLERNVAEEATRNFATWWMDLGMTGWFNDPGMWEMMRKLAAVDRPFLAKPIPFRPEIAAVIDERSMLLASAGAWKATEPGVYMARSQLGRTGAPYGQYLLDDVLNGRVKTRVYFFLNAWQLSSEQRKAIRAHTAGALKVWLFAPGMLDGSNISPDAMRELTGFRLQQVTPVKARAVPTAAGERMGLHQSFGVDGPVEPLFAAADATPAETLAVYPDGSAAVALRKTGDGWSLFIGAPGLTPELVRLAARAAGVHLYTAEECNVYANGPIIALHAPADGIYHLDTGRGGVVRDALTGEVVGRGPRFTLTLKKGETRVLMDRGDP